MASRISLDALPSAVTILKKKSKTYTKCCCRSIDKVISIVLLLVSICLLAVACGTQDWIQFTVRNNATDDRGLISIGLLRGSHSVRYGESPIANFINGSYFLNEKFSNIYLIRFYGSVGFSIMAMIISLVGVLVTLVNSYQTVTTWWKGPPMIYILSFIAGFCGVVAMVFFIDYYLWAINTDNIFVSVTTLSSRDALAINNITINSFEYLITEEGYNLSPMLHYSFILGATGACVPLVVTLIAWRMALKLPVKNMRIHGQPANEFLMTKPMSIQQSGFGSPTLETPSSFDYEKVTTSKSQDSNGQRKQTKKVGISMERTEFLY